MSEVDKKIDEPKDPDLGAFEDLFEGDLLKFAMGNQGDEPEPDGDGEGDGADPDEPKKGKSDEPDGLEDDLDKALKDQKKKRDKAKKASSKKEPDKEPEEDDESGEASFVKTFAEAYFEREGLSLESDDVPETVEEFMDFIDTIIEHRSVPEFASPEVERINKFVENGGDLRSYLERTSTGLDYDEESIVDQKRAITDLLKRQGLSNEQIKRKISKYEDAGILEDEGIEAIELLTQYAEEDKARLLKQSEEQKREYQQQQREYQQLIVSEVRQMKDIHGVVLTEQEKKKLLEYGFKPDATGQTEFAKKFQSSPKYLIEAIYMTMFEDKFKTAAKAAGEKSALDKLKDKLNSGVKHKSSIKQSATSKKGFWEDL
jgi:DNA-binding transcriptional MerR regulator